MKPLIKLIARRDGQILKHHCFRNEDRTMAAIFSKAYGGAEVEVMVKFISLIYFLP